MIYEPDRKSIYMYMIARFSISNKPRKTRYFNHLMEIISVHAMLISLGQTDSEPYINYPTIKCLYGSV